jgi:hypothetical protein
LVVVVARCHTLPELKNEIPTQDELWSYFIEHYPWMNPSGTGIWVDGPEMQEACERFGCRQLLTKVGDTIWAALQELNALPRSAPLWANTNRRPTVYKLRDFARLQLQANAEDELALWTLAVSHGANDLARDYWKRLWQLGVLDIKWPIWAGLWQYFNVGFEPVLMASLIAEMDAAEAASPILEDMLFANSSLIREWAQGVITALKQPKANP